MTASPITIDQESRRKIVREINQNFFVEAGAGSGKTTTLVERMVAMVESGIDISKICAITFTKAAANEFYARFQKRLIERSNEKEEDWVDLPNKLGKPDNTTRQRCREALNNIDLAFMGTIDSFCNMIMSEHPSEGLIPSDSRVIDNDEAGRIYKKEYANILNGLYNDTDLEVKAANFLKFNKNPEEIFNLTLAILLSNRDCEVFVPEYEFIDIDEQLKDFINTVRRIVNVLADNQNFLYGSNADEIFKNITGNRNLLMKKWNDNIPNVLDALLYSFKYNKKSPDGLRLILSEEVEDALKEGIDYFVAHDSKGKWYELDNDKFKSFVSIIEEIRYAVNVDFVNSAKNRILAKLRKEGKLTFTDYLIYLRDTLQKDAQSEGKLIRHIYERHSYFLIDEFQDTDPIQAQIFFYLAAKEIKPKWNDCIPYPGSLFIVGDPKQSIYRFKNADVASFLKIREMFKGEIGEVLGLFSNFRSTYELRDWFNKTFTPLLEDTDEQAAYPLIPIDESEKDPDVVSGIYYYDVPYTKNKEDPYDYDEYKVKETILKLVHNEKYKIKEKGVLRTLDWKDFMVITPGKDNLKDFAKEFRKNNIPYYVEGNIHFNESRAFETLCLLFAAATLDDNRYLYGTLKSGLFRIKEKEIIEAVKNGYEIRRGVKTDGIKISDKLKTSIETINQYMAKTRYVTPSVLFARMIEDSESFRWQGNVNLEYVYFALELLKDAEKSGKVITYEDAAYFLLNLLTGGSNEERCPGLKKEFNKVHMANLHKVKGLEAPVVILAHPRKKGRNATFRLERNEAGNIGYLIRTMKKCDNGQDKVLYETSLFPQMEAKEKESKEAEDLRLQYVAATRAKNLLIISYLATGGHVQSKTSRWYDLLNGIAAPCVDILAHLNSDEVKENKRNIINYDDVVCTSVLTEDKLNELKKETMSVKRPSSQTDKVNIQEHDAEISERLRMSIDETDDNFSTVIGTMVHRMMEIIILTKKEISDSTVEDIVDECMVLGFEDEKDNFKDILKNVRDVIFGGGFDQCNGAEKDILKVINEADETYPEVPFTYCEGTAIWNGIIDFIYKKDGKLHIIDWKTNKTSLNLGEHYKGQLEAYKDAVEKLTGEQVEDALIYHIDINGK